MGVVWSAWDNKTKREVAIKLLPADNETEERRKRLMREAEVISAIKHDNVIKFHEVGQHQRHFFVVMERLEGTALSQYGARPMRMVDAIGLVMPAIRGVAAAHSKGYLHRDVKPDNIFLLHDDTGIITGTKVLDFGISKLALESPKDALTAAGTVLGTPAYMAPEQLTGATLDGRCDQYAFACLIWELVEGNNPFDSNYFAVLSERKLKGEVCEPKNLPPELTTVLSRALSLKPDDRYESLVDFGRALEKLAPDFKFGTRRGLSDATRRRSGLALTIITLLICAIVAIAVYVINRAPPERPPSLVSPINTET